MARTTKKPVTVLQVIERTIAIFKTKGAKAWIKGAYAKNRKGEECEATSKAACSFCLEGAALRAINDLGVKGYDAAQQLFRQTDNAICNVLQDLYNLDRQPNFNDAEDTTFREVTTLLQVTKRDLERKAA